MNHREKKKINYVSKGVLTFVFLFGLVGEVEVAKSKRDDNTFSSSLVFLEENAKV